MVTGGAIQMEIGDEMHTVRTGFTMVAPPGVPHRLINQLWTPATMLVIYPDSELQTNFLE
jgi:quercetin dioxygenase-like cupin family protein